MADALRPFFPHMGRDYRAPENARSLAATEPVVERFVDGVVRECALTPVTDRARTVHREGLLYRHLARLLKARLDLARRHQQPEDVALFVEFMALAVDEEWKWRQAQEERR